jgi:catechol 2,3-dioxygenase-like lactoylglutathione lyase family enzyme
MLMGFNHLTLAVTDISRSVDFYRFLGFRPIARWSAGAYLSLEDLWLCISLHAARTLNSRSDYTHYAFSISPGDFLNFVSKVRAAGIREWQVNKSEGHSIYFYDPDLHKLEAHVGNLQTRLQACRANPYRGMEFFD